MNKCGGGGGGVVAEDDTSCIYKHHVLFYRLEQRYSGSLTFKLMAITITSSQKALTKNVLPTSIHFESKKKQKNKK